ncbi:type II secretion system F family protein [Rothia sp. CCM 9418]|uniref:type II secretion system F family protein n=1 Tax=Rothia sp. CCM 9418 TaxID=3402661 RepID=UPI003AE21279
MSILLILSLILAAGLWLVGDALYRGHTTDFSDRIAPQLKAIEMKTQHLHARNQHLGLISGSVELIRPISQSIQQRFNSSTANSVALQKRLIHSGSSMDVTTFRAEQLVWATTSLLLSILIFGTGALRGNIDFIAAFLLSIFCAITGFLARDWWLTQNIKQRESQMIAEFPALAELMALSVTAGESALGAIERVCNCSSGELATEFQKILSQMRSGDSLVNALQDFSQRTSLPPLSRFVDGIVVAIERGTPLADVLRAQAQDVRDNAKRELMEIAGKKEIAMMAPIIFFILPLTVVFAIFPGLSLINLNF